MQTKHFTFSLATKRDHELIIGWLHAPHVSPYYYGVGLQNTLNDLAKENLGIHHHWLAYYDGKPIGFLMTSDVEKDEEIFRPHSKYADLEKAITLDLLIGDTNYLGKGLAAPMIIEFLQEKFSDVDDVFIDPSVSNERAIHVYEKAGFVPCEEMSVTYSDDNVLLMHLQIKELRDSH